MNQSSRIQEMNLVGKVNYTEQTFIGFEDQGQFVARINSTWKQMHFHSCAISKENA